MIERDGFVIVDRPRIDIRSAYDAAVAASDPADVSSGSTGSSTRAHDFVNRGELFDRFWQDLELLAICGRMFLRPFKLGTFLARAVNPGGGPQALHVDHARDEDGTTLVGFLWMIDEFREDNGATQFAPGSHVRLPNDRRVLVTGAPGTLVVYDGAIWHGYTKNRTTEPRRSLQGSFILRTMQQTPDQRTRLRPETAARLDARARNLLDL